MSEDDDPHRGDHAATDLTPEEKVGLIPTWIVTRDDLNRAERSNITAGLRWARRGRIDVLDPHQLMALHTRMYGHVWRWAGQPRTSAGRPSPGANPTWRGWATPGPPMSRP